MKHLIIVASPRIRGRSAAVASALGRTLAAADPAAEVRLIELADARIAPCTACGACEGLAARAGAERAGAERCVVRDDMARVYEALDACGKLWVVSPVFFAGPPAQLKSLFDRLQPYYWGDWRRTPKRPAELFVVGDGGDPHGFAPLVSIARSALAVAGFRLGDVHDLVGLLSEGAADVPAGEALLQAGRVRPAADYACPLPPCEGSAPPAGCAGADAPPGGRAGADAQLGGFAAPPAATEGGPRHG